MQTAVMFGPGSGMPRMEALEAMKGLIPQCHLSILGVPLKSTKTVHRVLCLPLSTFLDYLGTSAQIPIHLAPGDPPTRGSPRQEQTKNHPLPSL